MYDVIIVGARVAGSATALLLARQGVRVLVLDRAAFPSDTLSTHQVQVPGIARLNRWGVLDAVLAAGTPKTRSVRFDASGIAFTAAVPTVDGVDFMCSPRRTTLDHAVVSAARAAGAEIRENVVVQEILRRDGRVVGIRAQEKNGPVFTEEAGLVVGADGKNSTVARAVGAREYRTVPARTMACYTYWADVPVSGGEIYSRAGRAAGLWPTNDGLVMSYLAAPVGEFAEFRRDIDGHALRAFDGFAVGERLRAGRRAERWRATPDLPARFRHPYGPGWALVGDAGLVLDPITGLGISDALRDAEQLAAAIAGAGNERTRGGALERYRRNRDRAARPMYDFTAMLAGLSVPRPVESDLFKALSRNSEYADMFIAALTGSIPLRQFQSPAVIVRLIGMRGLFSLLSRGGREVNTGSTPVVTG
jgi:2-polyprenyl-6-methoxyphenol hydroxylase-like FAD-dependent oxidoreductase